MERFKTLKGIVIDNIVDYVNDYLKERPDTEILIGSDSQSYSNKKTVYGVVLALYSPGKGAHVICTRETLPMEFNLNNRLMTEVWKSIELANFLCENGIKKPKYIDIDLNPDKKYKSNSSLRAAMGFVESMGYNVRCKHEGAIMTYAANHLVRM